MNLAPVYLAIGHACHDLIPGGRQIGGTVSFALRLAHLLGCETHLLTSTAEDFPFATVLPDTLVYNIPSPHTTTFENVPTNRGRVQTLHARAHTLQPAHLPHDWPAAAIIHLAPIANEISPDLIVALSSLPSHPSPFLCLTPQGWLRTWNAQGHISPCAWPEAEQILPLATAVVLSQEDLPDAAALETFRTHARLLVVTAGANGCDVYMDGVAHHVPVDPVPDVESTGAGDLFAAAFFIRLYQTGNPLASAHFANQIAAQSVTQTHLTAKIRAIETFMASMSPKIGSLSQSEPI
jgi:sugar/nucleoside kinase (ribokinase family)